MGDNAAKFGLRQMRLGELTHSADLETNKAFNRSVGFTQVKLANVFHCPIEGTGFPVLARRENRGRPSASNAGGSAVLALGHWDKFGTLGQPER